MRSPSTRRSAGSTFPTCNWTRHCSSSAGTRTNRSRASRRTPASPTRPRRPARRRGRASSSAPSPSSTDAMIELHYWPTPNGKKVSILLEELGMPYRVVPVNIGRGDQFADGFLSISPNNRMPAIVDTEPKGGGAPISVFESGAILFYLAEKAGRLWPQQDLRAKYEVMQWVIWQMANQGPKFGERGHFSRVPDSAGDQSYAKRRFNDEVHRLYGVLNH